MIVEELIDNAAALAGPKTVADVRIGLGTTAVLLSDGACGLSYTVHPNSGGHCHVLDQAGNLSGRPAREASAWAMDADPGPVGVGIARAQRPVQALVVTRFSRENAMDAIDIRTDDTLGVVGHFAPLLERHGECVDRLYVFEREAPGNTSIPTGPRTSTSRTATPWSSPARRSSTRRSTACSLCTSAARDGAVGVPTHLCPEVFRAHGVTMLAGARVTDAGRALRVVSEGGSMPGLHGCTEHLCIRL